MAVTTSARSWNDCSTFKQMQRHFVKIGVSVVFIIGSIVFLAHLTRIFMSSVILLSPFILRTSTLFFRTCNGKPFFVCLNCVELNHVMDSLSSSASTVPSVDAYFGHNVWNPVLEMLFFSSKLVVFSPPISSKSTWPRSHFLVTSLLIYYATRKRCLPLHDDTLGHHCPWRSLHFCGTIATLVSSCLFYVWRVATNFCFTFSYFLLLQQFSSRMFPYPYVALVRTVTICHRGDTLCSSGQGTTSGLTLYPKRLRR